MTRRLAAFVVLALLPWQQAPASEGPNDSHELIAEALKRNLVGKATLDGNQVTDVAQHGSCLTKFSTSQGSVEINWVQVENVISRKDGPDVVVSLKGETLVSQLHVPQSIAKRIEASLTVLYGDCQPR